MNAAVRELLNSFDSLPDVAKHQAAVEILRRTADTAIGDLPEECLIESAEELFCAMDEAETNDAAS